MIYFLNKDTELLALRKVVMVIAIAINRHNPLYYYFPGLLSYNKRLFFASRLKLKTTSHLSPGIEVGGD
jgi:hypothetical protein